MSARLAVTDQLSIGEDECEERFVRASGPGGQNVNKVSSAVMLRFDLARSPSLPDAVKHRLARLAGRRLTQDGVIVIMADEHRTQDMNRTAARARLLALIADAAVAPKPRRKTRPTLGSVERRHAAKRVRSSVKAARGRPEGD